MLNICTKYCKATEHFIVVLDAEWVVVVGRIKHLEKKHGQLHLLTSWMVLCSFTVCSFQMIVYGRINQSVQVQWTSDIWTPDTQTKQFTLNRFYFGIAFLCCFVWFIQNSTFKIWNVYFYHKTLLNFKFCFNYLFIYMVKWMVSLHYR